MIIHDVEQGSDEWHKLRAGIPTASEFSKLVTSKGAPSKSLEPYAIQLAADGIAGEPVDRWGGNEWTERGHEMEDRARAWYESEFPDCEVKQVGFVTDDGEQWGMSPDSMVVDLDADQADDEKLILEIKCLKATNHIKAIMYYKKNGVMPTDYVQQTQGQLLVSSYRRHQLLFWHPDLPALLIETRPDSNVLAPLLDQLEVVMARRDKIMAMLNAM